MQSITSAKNPTVLQARALQKKAARDESGLFLCEGEHMAGEALRAGAASAVFVDEGLLQRFDALLTLAPSDCPIYAVPSHVMEALSLVKAPQGVVAVARQPAAAPLSVLGDRVLLLENVQDPGNVGTLLRTLDAAGFTGCALGPGCADPFGDKALRATMGSVFRVPLHFAASAARTVEALNGCGYRTYAAVLDGQPYYQRGPAPQKLCLLIGNEGAGLTPETAAACTHRVRLPMRGGAESLNAAIAGAILMYDLMNR